MVTTIHNQLRSILDKKKTSEVFTEVLGQKKTKEQMMSALISGRHILIIGPPGIGKTTIAKSLSKMLPETEGIEGCEYHCSPDMPFCPKCKENGKIKSVIIPGEKRFVRVQGSPDLTVEDLIGDIDPIKALKFGPLSPEAFTPGKIFKANNGILFFDEINRCPEKLQNALLQVMQEKKATIGSYDFDFNADFILIATMNPEDFSGTEKLSDVLLDRFDVVYMSYPESIDTEIDIVINNGIKLVEVPQKILTMMVYFVRMLRESDKLEKKPSVRATIGLYERAQSFALLNNRKKVDFSDFQNVLVSVLAHRIKLKPSLEYLKTPSDFLTEEFEKALASNIARELKKNEGEYP